MFLLKGTGRQGELCNCGWWGQGGVLQVLQAQSMEIAGAKSSLASGTGEAEARAGIFWVLGENSVLKTSQADRLHP